MNIEKLYENFEKGVFPSDSEMEEAIIGTDYEDIFDLEMDLIKIAENDVNHKYHSKTLPMEVDFPDGIFN